VAKLNTEWAIVEIDKFLHMTEQVAWENDPYSGVVMIGSSMRAESTDASAQAHVVEQILDRVPAMAGWRKSRPAKDLKYDWLRDQASRAKAALQREAELKEKLGDNAPDMDAANLHPWAWESGRSFWNNGFFQAAVMEAAKKINSETQAKIGRVDIGEVNLFQQAFSLDAPKPNAPRLRLAKNDGSDTFKNLHQGARAFAEGLYWAIRNPGMHTPSPADGGEEQLALEQLAAFSLLARWVEEAIVETAF
jgi:hypothetical protein